MGVILGWYRTELLSKETAVLLEVEAVVGGEYDGGFVHEPGLWVGCAPLARPVYLPMASAREMTIFSASGVPAGARQTPQRCPTSKKPLLGAHSSSSVMV